MGITGAILDQGGRDLALVSICPDCTSIASRKINKSDLGFSRRDRIIDTHHDIVHDKFILRDSFLQFSFVRLILWHEVHLLRRGCALVSGRKAAV